MLSGRAPDCQCSGEVCHLVENITAQGTDATEAGGDSPTASDNQRTGARA
jgi:hypothetical protein